MRSGGAVTAVTAAARRRAPLPRRTHFPSSRVRPTHTAKSTHSVHTSSGGPGRGLQCAHSVAALARATKSSPRSRPRAAGERWARRGRNKDRVSMCACAGVRVCVSRGKPEKRRARAKRFASVCRDRCLPAPACATTTARRPISRRHRLLTVVTAASGARGGQKQQRPNHAAQTHTRCSFTARSHTCTPTAGWQDSPGDSMVPLLADANGWRPDHPAGAASFAATHISARAVFVFWGVGLLRLLFTSN